MNKFPFWKSRTFWLMIRIHATILGGLFLLLMLTAENVLSDYSKQHYETLIQNKISQLENQVNSLLAEFENLAFYVQEEAQPEEKNTSQLNNYLKNIVEISPHINGGTIVNGNGDVIGYYPEDLQFIGNLMEREYVQQAFELETTYFSSVIHTEKRNIIAMAVPLQENQEVEYVVNLSIHLSDNTLFHSIFEDMEITADSYAYVLDQNNRIIFHPDKEKIGKDISSDPITKVAATRTAGYETVTNTSGDHFYVSYDYIGSLGWTVVALVPVDSTFLASQEFRNILLPIFVILSVGILIIITFMMQRYLQPYNKLSKAVGELAKGKFVAFIENPDERTEIGKITAQFNVMAAELQQYKADIQRKARELIEQRNFMNRIINHNPNAIYAMNWSGEYKLANQVLADIYGLTSDEIIGKKEEMFSPDKAAAQRYMQINRQIIKGGEEKELEDYLIDKDGNKRWFHIEKVPIFHNGEPLVLTVATDITERKEQEEVITYQAYHDELTGVPNRKAFQTRLVEESEAAQTDNSTFALLFLDLDRFKYVNDTFGHESGDELLREVTSRLKSCLANQGTFFRLGGDEFTVIIPGTPTRKTAAEISKQLLTILSEPYYMEGNRLTISVSIGISFFSHDCLDTESLVKQADLAMYKAKEQGKDTFRFYTPDMETEAAFTGKLEMDLYHALAEEELFIQYQPIMNTHNEEMERMEALLRWEHPELGLISPGEFISIAETTGLIHSIGEWVLEKVCKQQKKWLEIGMEPIKISVNLSPVQLKRTGIVEIVKNMLHTYELDGKWLELEVTETTIMENKQEAVKLLEKLRSLGIRIALDDFGTGYSSLNMLHEMPVDTLKIDRSLVTNLSETETTDHFILNAVFDIAKKMNLTVIAEGVETLEQFNYLKKEKHCHYVQGFLFSQPLTEEQLSCYLDERAV